MIPAHLNVIRSEFKICPAEWKGSRHSHLRAMEVPPREIHFWLSPKAKVGVTAWRPQQQSSKLCWEKLTDQPTFPPIWAWLHQNILSSLVHPLKCFISITLETFKKKGPETEERGLFVTIGSSALPSCWGRSHSPWPLHHTPATFCVNTSNSQACLINHSPRNLWDKVHITPRAARRTLEVRMQDRTKLPCQPHPSSCNLLPVL